MYAHTLDLYRGIKYRATILRCFFALQFLIGETNNIFIILLQPLKLDSLLRDVNRHSLSLFHWLPFSLSLSLSGFASFLIHSSRPRLSVYRGTSEKMSFARCPHPMQTSRLFVRYFRISMGERYSVSKSFYLVIRFSIYSVFFRVWNCAWNFMLLARVSRSLPFSYILPFRGIIKSCLWIINSDTFAIYKRRRNYFQTISLYVLGARVYISCS